MLLLAKPAVALVTRHRAQHAGGDGHHRRRAGHVRPRTARLLRVPLLRARAAVDAAHQGGVLLVPRRERAQRRPGSGAGAPARSPRPGAQPLHRVHRRCASWRSRSSISGSGGWPTVPRGRRCGVSSSPASRWPSSCSWSPTSRGRPPSLASRRASCGAVVAGGLTFGAVVVLLGRRHDARRPPPTPPAPPAHKHRRGRWSPRSGGSARSARPGAPDRPSLRPGRIRPDVPSS